MDKFAPVLIPTLNRYEHFRRCVESLSRCTHAEKTDLFIALDLPLNDSHWEGYRKIVEYLPTIQGFNSIEVIQREKNFGARENLKNSMKIIFGKFDRIIFSEDDNEFSPNFLDYINKGLDKFEADDRVLAICGYLYPVTINCSEDYNYFYGKGFSAWGYGTWKNRNFKDIYTVFELEELLKNKKIIKKIKRFDERRFFNILSYIAKKKNPTGDRAIATYLIEDDKFCIFPIISKVRNWGHDGSGIHCGTISENIFSKQTIDCENCFNYSLADPLSNKCLNNVIPNYFKLPLRQKIKLYIKYQNYNTYRFYVLLKRMINKYK